MSRTINELFVCETSTFSGAALFLEDTSLSENANLIFGGTGSNQLTFRDLGDTQSGANQARMRDLGTGVADYFVMEDVEQTLTNKTLTNPQINAIYDTMNNIALNICVADGSDQANLNTFELCGTTGDTITLGAAGSSTDISILLQPKGAGVVQLDDLIFPSGTGSAGQVLQTDGNGNLSFVTTLTPTEATLGTTSAATTACFDLGTVDVNSVSLFNARIVGVTDKTDDNESGAFILKTAYKRGALNANDLAAVGNPMCDDLLKFLDDSGWNAYTRVKPGSSSIVELCVVGDLTDDVTFKLTTQAIDISSA